MKVRITYDNPNRNPAAETTTVALFGADRWFSPPFVNAAFVPRRAVAGTGDTSEATG